MEKERVEDWKGTMKRTSGMFRTNQSKISSWKSDLEDCSRTTANTRYPISKTDVSGWLFLWYWTELFYVRIAVPKIYHDRGRVTRCLSDGNEWNTDVTVCRHWNASSIFWLVNSRRKWFACFHSLEATYTADLITLNKHCCTRAFNTQPFGLSLIQFHTATLNWVLRLNRPIDSTDVFCADFYILEPPDSGRRPSSPPPFPSCNQISFGWKSLNFNDHFTRTPTFYERITV